MNDQSKLPFEDEVTPDDSRRRQGGEARSDLVVSSHLADNAKVFPQILDLHVPKQAVVADVTFGQGVFWRNVSPDDYVLLATDAKTGTRWADLSYPPDSLDAIVFDPPYMEGLYRDQPEALAGSGTHVAFKRAYSNGETTAKAARKYHDAVLDAYLGVIEHMTGMLREGGKFIVKCQDEVSANRQKLTHVELIWAFEARGYYCKDLFVLMRSNRPGVSRIVRQEHARKNHSYFLVFEKQASKRRLAYSNFSGWLVERDADGAVHEREQAVVPPLRQGPMDDLGGG